MPLYPPIPTHKKKRKENPCEMLINVLNITIILLTKCERIQRCDYVVCVCVCVCIVWPHIFQFCITIYSRSRSFHIILYNSNIEYHIKPYGGGCYLYQGRDVIF